MIERQTNIWDVYGKSPICITTNGFTKVSGAAVCGRGLAKQACYKLPEFSSKLGEHIRTNGNVVGILYGTFTSVNDVVFSFPVKPVFGVCCYDRSNVVTHMQSNFNPGDIVPGWAMRGSYHIIERSLWELSLFFALATHTKDFSKKIYLPKPGCGAGELSWEDTVRPLCERYGDWLVVVDRK